MRSEREAVVEKSGRRRRWSPAEERANDYVVDYCFRSLVLRLAKSSFVALMSRARAERVTNKFI